MKLMVKWNHPGSYWCFFCPSVEKANFWQQLPDERLRIISKPDLIYVPCRQGHPNDLPRHGHHQSPPTRGHCKHAWGSERVAHQSAHRPVYVWARVHMLCTNLYSVNVYVDACVENGFVGGNLGVLLCAFYAKHVCAVVGVRIKVWKWVQSTTLGQVWEPDYEGWGTHRVQSCYL